jgi:hypothetical protein
MAENENNVAGEAVGAAEGEATQAAPAEEITYHAVERTGK